jgi:hypothetical protein
MGLYPTHKIPLTLEEQTQYPPSCYEVPSKYIRIFSQMFNEYVERLCIITKKIPPKKKLTILNEIGFPMILNLP